MMGMLEEPAVGTDAKLEDPILLIVLLDEYDRLVPLISGLWR